MNFSSPSFQFNFNPTSIIPLIFHFFILFVVIYSGLTMFALIRFGRSRLLGLAASVAYMIIVGSLYLQVALLLAKL